MDFKESKQEYEELLQQQVDQVRSESWEITLIEEDPVSIEVYSSTEDRMHTIVPYNLACSCTVQGRVGMLCDHLIAIMDTDGFAGALTREYLKERRFKLQSESPELNDGDMNREPCQCDGTLRKWAKITAFLNVIDADHSAARTQVETVNMLNQCFGNSNTDNQQEAPAPDEDRAAFRAMVKRVRIEEQDKWLPGCL